MLTVSKNLSHILLLDFFLFLHLPGTLYSKHTYQFDLLHVLDVFSWIFAFAQNALSCPLHELLILQDSAKCSQPPRVRIHCCLFVFIASFFALVKCKNCPVLMQRVTCLYFQLYYELTEGKNLGSFLS
jgi:hypothetical protein